MEITVKQIETFEVIPDMFKGEDTPPSFIFRTPNTVDMTNLTCNQITVHGLLFDCFVEFKNKPVIKDGNGKAVKYTNYKELMEIGNSEILTLIHTECIIAMTSKINEVREKGAKTVKKSK